MLLSLIPDKFRYQVSFSCSDGYKGYKNFHVILNQTKTTNIWEKKYEWCGKWGRGSTNQILVVYVPRILCL